MVEWAITWEEFALAFVLAIIAAIIVEKYSLLKYFKKLYEWLLIKGEQLRVFMQLLPRLYMISNESSRDYEKMVDFEPCPKCNYPIIKASDSTSSLHMKFYFSITNRSIFDFKVEKISMDIRDQNYSHNDKIDKSKEIDLPHQQVIEDSFIYELPLSFIAELKSLKEKRESLWIILENVNIYLNNKKFPIFCGQRFNLRIHPRDIHL